MSTSLCTHVRTDEALTGSSDSNDLPRVPLVSRRVSDSLEKTRKLFLILVALASTQHGNEHCDCERYC